MQPDPETGRPSPPTTVNIKQEPVDEPATPWSFSRDEVVNLLSDDEDDDDMTEQPRTSMAMRAPSEDDDVFTSQPSQPTPQAITAPTMAPIPSAGAEITAPDVSNASRPLNLGNSIFTRPRNTGATGPAPSVQKMLDVQRKWADLLRARNQATGPPMAKNGSETILSPPPSAIKGRSGGKPDKDADAARYEKQKAAFEHKRRSGTAILQDEIEFMKIQHEEEARLRKIKADEEYDRTPTPEAADHGLFLSDGEAEPLGYSAMISDDETPAPKKRKRTSRDDEEEDFDQGAVPARKRGRPKGSAAASKKGKKSTKVPDTDYTQDDAEDVLERAKRQTKKKAGATTKAKPVRGNKAGPTMTNLSSIKGADVFGDTAATKHLPNQPRNQKTGGGKDIALRALVASIPTESKGVASTDRHYLDEAIRDFAGHATVRPHEDGNWSVKGMRTTLKHYQIMGTAFLRRRENGEKPYGGILADQMGLGKTIMMLANIVNDRPKKTAKHRATLIVASPALVSQWAAEIQKHTLSQREHKQYGIGTVIQHHAGHRVTSNNTLDLLESADIVLSTYSEVCRSYPKAVIPPNLVTAKEKDDWWKDYYEENKGVLHHVRFHRIVLDEAQAIKNHRSQTSMACRALVGKHHWAITGTPILNSVKELYPYFKFLKEPHTGIHKIFKENFCTPNDPDGTERLSVLLRKLMIRRTHIDRLFDARLLDLPNPAENTLWLEFNDVERQIYEIVKKRFVNKVNTIAKQDGLEKQYHHIWTMILRLRQICGHILLVQGTITDLLEREDFEKLNKITESEHEMSEEGASLLVHLRNVLKNNRGTKTMEGGISGAVISENEIVETGLVDIVDTLDQTGGKHGCSYRFRKYLDSLVNSEHWDAIQQRCLCTGCRQPPKDPHVTSCFHIYCLACLTDLQHLAARRGHDQARCSECGTSYVSVQKCEGLDTFDRGASTDSASQAPGTDSTPAGKGKKAKKDKTDDWIDMKGEVLPSAKTQAVKAQVLNWLEEDPDAKIIIYSQFLPMIKILEKICRTEGWSCVKYTGEMSHESREKAITEFGTTKAQLMLASLRAGGLGLNLTMASRVICLDPWWNSAVEQQAFCRVIRIGQQKETQMTRFVIKNTIDAAMMAMKDRKDKEIEEVMDDAKRKKRPSIHDLMRLFGPVGEDGEGKPFIFADDQHDEGDPEHLRLANDDEEDEDMPMGNEA